MATIKAYTDIKQSKKLAQILPLESADQTWARVAIAGANLDVPEELQYRHNGDMPFQYYSGIGIPCWSLAALLSVLPKEIEIEGHRYAPCLFPIQDKWLLKLWYNSNYTITSPIAIFSDNPIDACYEMIIKLHELNLL